MPFFYVPGNHDLANKVQAKLWQEKFGRRYYHFVYNDVLFLMLEHGRPARHRAAIVRRAARLAKKTLDGQRGARAGRSCCCTSRSGQATSSRNRLG